MNKCCEEIYISCIKNIRDFIVTHNHFSVKYHIEWLDMAIHLLENKEDE